MLAKIRSWVGWLVATTHNVWAQLPVAAQAALVVLAFALWQFYQGYGWYVPGDPTNVRAWLAEFLNAAALAWAVALPIIRDKVWPALIPWILALFDLKTQVRSVAAAAVAAGKTKAVILWKARI